MPPKIDPTRRTEYVRLSDVRDADRNPKLHEESVIGESITEFGFIDSPIIDERTGQLVGGHGRTDDMRRRKALGLDPPEGVRVADDGEWLLPVQRGWASKDDQQALKAGIALNRSTELGGWNVAELESILSDFVSEGDDASLYSTGFSVEDLEAMTLDLHPLVPEAPPEFPDAELLAGHTQHRCPSCGYEWSGSSTPETGE
jgi:hypothetical protein